MMDHKTFALLLDTPETEWTQEQRRAMEAHAAECADCALLLAMRREMRAMDAESELPATFSAAWRNAIREEEEKKMAKKSFVFGWKKALAAVAAVAVVAVGTAVSYNNGWGLGQTANGKQGAAYDYSAREIAEYSAGAASYDSGAGNYLMTAKTSASSDMRYDYDESAPAEAEAGAREQKIIRTVNFTLKTQQYEQDYEALRQLVQDFGGRIESLSVSGDGTAYSLRRANFTVRVPSARLDDFINGARGVGNVSAYSESSDDVSESYYDMRSRLETQQTKLKRLVEMMEKAEDISDLIELEGAISDTQYWIDYYTGQLNGYDSRVSESYVYITLREISSATAADEKELSFGERIVNAIKASLESAVEVAQAFVIFILAALPWIAALVLVIVLVRVVIRRRKAKKAAKAQAKAEE